MDCNLTTKALQFFLSYWNWLGDVVRMRIPNNSGGVPLEIFGRWNSLGQPNRILSAYHSGSCIVQQVSASGRRDTDLIRRVIINGRIPKHCCLNLKSGVSSITTYKGPFFAGEREWLCVACNAVNNSVLINKICRLISLYWVIHACYSWSHSWMLRPWACLMLRKKEKEILYVRLMHHSTPGPTLLYCTLPLANHGQKIRPWSIPMSWTMQSRLNW